MPYARYTCPLRYGQRPKFAPFPVCPRAVRECFWSLTRIEDKRLTRPSPLRTRRRRAKQSRSTTANVQQHSPRFIFFNPFRLALTEASWGCTPEGGFLPWVTTASHPWLLGFKASSLVLFQIFDLLSRHDAPYLNAVTPLRCLFYCQLHTAYCQLVTKA